ncbi:MAG: alpha/beta hydrolase, partial [Pseudanabaena sp. M165S2SP1A06QC]|nr:alpha/beta hydrolase [Pseudanabaena sp. M165S2SP1A06QC]
MNLQESNAQLVIRKYNQHGTTFAHCLICSTAPINAESHYREDLSSIVCIDSSNPIDDIKLVLSNFIKAKWGGSGKDVLNKISIVLDIHGFNVPLKNLEKNTYEPLVKKFKDDASGKTFEDFVLFINFSWPSEQVITSQWLEWIKAMPIVLWILMGISIALLLSNTLSSLALILMGMLLLLIFLRLVVYFRDRERASNYGVFDAVDLVRWLQVILQEVVEEESANRGQAKEDLKHFGRANLRFIAHSMGCFVVTNTIRILSDVFDSHSIDRWKKTAPNGPFETEPKSTESLEKDKEMQNIGTLLKLKTLVIASPDIPIWAITSGRSNFLKSCLRRFEEAFLFTNDADLVLRLAATVANYFVFPSSSLVGGYRLGNL